MGRLRRTLENVERIAVVCAGSDEIRLHVPVIDNEAMNYHIRALQRRYPFAVFSVRLIPDGVLNIQRHPLTPVQKASQYLRKFRRLLCADLDYYLYRGDQTGADAPIVDKIYTLAGLPHEYDPAKVESFSLFSGEGGPGGTPFRNQALVVGLWVRGSGPSPSREIKELGLGIRRFLQKAGITEIHYKAHPRDRHRQLYHPDYQAIEPDEPLEKYLLKNPYRMVIGVNSTTLLLTKLIFQHRIRVVSYGLDYLIHSRMKAGDEKLKTIMMKLGIELMDYTAE
jgi:hypothetical protein